MSDFNSLINSIAIPVLFGALGGVIAFFIFSFLFSFSDWARLRNKFSWRIERLKAMWVNRCYLSNEQFEEIMRGN